MKITCEYCGTLFDDTLESCPNCGSQNPGVKRKKSSKPTTIEELQDWYQHWGLPPYETTRFFIGENYKGRRAFGIYRDERTGNVIVYKNKDNGQRAIRYEGTDEAYAVNEIFQRLKQEIITQKSANSSRRSGGDSFDSGSDSGYSVSSAKRAKQLTEDYAYRQRASAYRKEPPRKSSPLGLFGDMMAIFMGLLWKAIKIFLICIGSTLLLLIGAVIILLIIDEPSRGYYFYDDAPYYYYINENKSSDAGWFPYDEEKDCWIEESIPEDSVPKALKKDKHAREYFAEEEWSESLGVADFSQTLYYQDRLHNFEVDTGYYQREGITYYHYTSLADNGWYFYDDDKSDWSSVSYTDIPEDFKHGSVAEDFYFTPEWDSSTQFTDFTDSAAYDGLTSSKSTSSSGSTNSDSWDWGWDDDDDDYDSNTYTWDDDDDWDWGDTDWDSDW